MLKRYYTLSGKKFRTRNRKNGIPYRTPYNPKYSNYEYRKAKDIFREVLRHPFSGFCIADSHGIIKFFNSSMERIFGLPRQCLIGKNIQELTSLLNLNESGENVFDSMRSSGLSGRTEIIIDNRSKWIHYFLKKINLPGNSEFITLLHCDETQMNEWEYALFDDSRGNKAILQTIPVIIYSFSSLRGTLYCSPYVKNNLGYSVASLYRKPFFLINCIHNEDRDNVNEFIRKADPDSHHSIEFRIRDSADNWHYWVSRIIRKRTLEGEILLDGIAFDITERKQVEKILAESEIRHRSLFEESPISLWEEDASELKIYIDTLYESGIKDIREYLDAHPDKLIHCASLVRIVNVNKATVKLFKGRSKAQFLGRLSDFIVEDGLDDFKDMIVNIAEGAKVYNLESEQRTWDGSTFHSSINWTVAPGYEKTLEHVFVAVVDISESHNAKQKLLDYQNELRHLSSHLVLVEEEERRRIAAAIHDNIGQTLSTSIIKLKMLRKSLSSSKSTRFVDDILFFIDQAVNDARSLIFDLSPKNLYDLGLESAVSSLLDKIQDEHNLKCEFYSDTADTSIREDVSIFLYRATKEAVINAIKHARAHLLNVSLKEINGYISIVVEDNGRGFDVSRIENHSYDKGGFGLFDIRERLEYIGGNMYITSKPGRGTKIEIIAPIMPK